MHFLATARVAFLKITAPFTANAQLPRPRGFLPWENSYCVVLNRVFIQVFLFWFLAGLVGSRLDSTPKALAHIVQGKVRWIEDA